MLIELTAVLPIRAAICTYGVVGSPHMTRAVTSPAERHGEEGSPGVLIIASPLRGLVLQAFSFCDK
jgi:hypothetical protein